MDIMERNEQTDDCTIKMDYPHQLILKLYLCIVLCMATQLAWCAPVSVAADPQETVLTSAEIQEARESGRGEGSVEGLRKLIKQRQPRLIEYYGQFFGGWSYSKLSLGIEELVTQNMNDPVIGAALLGLTRNAKYQTRKLFELLDARITSAPKPDWVALSAISRTDLPDIEPEILKLAERYPAGQYDKDSAVFRFFGERKYAPAVPFLVKTMDGRKPGDLVIFPVADALTKIGTQAATTAVLDRLDWVARQTSDSKQVQLELQILVSSLSQMPESVPLDFIRLKKILPGKLLEANRSKLLDIAGKRKELVAVPDFLSTLVDEPQSAISNPAFKALLSFDSVEVWRKTRDEMERLYRAKEISDDYHASALRILDERLKAPEKILAQSRQASRVNAFNDRQTQIDLQKPGLQTLKSSDPEQYVTAQLKFLEMLTELGKEYSDLRLTTGLRSRVAEEYNALGNFVRFKLKQPAKAITLYKHAPDSLMAQIAAADTARFDLHDSASAIQYYEQLLSTLKNKGMPGNNPDVAMSTWLNTWIGHELVYLKTGKTFSGVLTEDDLAGFPFTLLLGTSMTQGALVELVPDVVSLSQSAYQGKEVTLGERKRLAKEIDALPASHFSLFSTIGVATMLPDANTVLYYFGKHDPTGYLTAFFFGAVNLFSKQAAQSNPALTLLPGARVDPEMLNLASRQFFKAHGIVLNIGPDPRLSSPEKTWILFIEALKNGDVHTVKMCLTPAMRVKLEPLFATMATDKLKSMAESFGKFSMRDNSAQYREAVVTRGNQVGFIYFVNSGGAWKIQEM